ncbi:MAG: hypothetical protein ACKOC8_03715 [Pirellulales bacterium]
MAEPVEYRPVSTLAVAAAIVGCCSAVALVTRLAWMVPLVGVGLSIAAFADIARSGGAKAGRLLALVGLALAAGFGSQAVSDAVVEHSILRHRAIAAARTWADAIRSGRPAEALAASAPTLLPPAGTPLGDAPESEEARLSRFQETSGAKDVMACGTAIPEVLDATPTGTDDRAWIVRLSLAPCGSATVLRLVVAPGAAGTTARPVERWLIRQAATER